MTEYLYSFLLRAPKKFRQNDSNYLYCFKHFWTNVSKFASSMIKNLSQLGPVKFLGLVSVMVLIMTMFLDEMKLRLVLMISPWCTEHPHCTHGIPHCTHDMTPVY